MAWRTEPSFEVERTPRVTLVPDIFSRGLAWAVKKSGLTRIFEEVILFLFRDGLQPVLPE